MPTSLPTAEALISLILEQGILETSDPLTADSDLFSLGMDSLALMQLFIQIEVQFCLKLPMEQVQREHCETPASLAQWVKKASACA